MQNIDELYIELINVKQQLKVEGKTLSGAEVMGMLLVILSVVLTLAIERDSVGPNLIYCVVAMCLGLLIIDCLMRGDVYRQKKSFVKETPSQNSL
ncbi:MAG: hypothetical protein KUG78_16465 [Kangiellaceae bacterium]|nr:hypothetical protein [Kangiellaceae bacterium]